MPFIVTTTPPCGNCRACEQGRPASCAHTDRTTRVAVATLDEARDLTVTVVGDRRAADPTETIDTLELASPRWDDRCTDAQRIPDEGGTVGPLPDGTTVLVERVSGYALLQRIHPAERRPKRDDPTTWVARIVDAWNHANGGTA